MTKTWAHILAIGLVVAILAPIHESLRGHSGDSFPLSWYPMFSRSRPALEPVTYVLGITASGERHVVHSKHHVQGTMNRARRPLTRLAKRPKTPALRSLRQRSRQRSLSSSKAKASK